MQLHIIPSKLVIHDKIVKSQQFYDTGRLWNEEYNLNGKRHNPNSPAYKAWHQNGQLSREDYYLNGQYHNPNGPAYRKWYENGQLHREEYYLNGIHYSKEEYDKLVK